MRSAKFVRRPPPVRKVQRTQLQLEPLEERTLLHEGHLNPLPQAAVPLLLPATSLVSQPERPPDIRKDQSTLTGQERLDFVDAVKQLKTRFRPGATISIYDEYVNAHYQAMLSGAIHDGPVFFPWHRAFLRNFELDLQAIHPKVTIPYWDFTVDNQPDSSLWASDFMGGNGDPTANGIVRDGPFRQGEWRLEFDGPDLRRQFGSFVPTLPTAAQVQTALQIERYDTPPYDVGSPVNLSFRNFMAGWNHPTAEPEMHNRVHNWVGGSMLTETSPNDPVFWLLHADLDRIWAQWESLHGYDYPVTGAPPGQNLRDPMVPFGLTPESVLQHHVLGYEYDTELAPSSAPISFATPGTTNGTLTTTHLDDSCCCCVSGEAFHCAGGHLPALPGTDAHTNHNVQDPSDGSPADCCCCCDGAAAPPGACGQPPVSPKVDPPAINLGENPSDLTQQERQLFIGAFPPANLGPVPEGSAFWAGQPAFLHDGERPIQAIPPQTPFSSWDFAGDGHADSGPWGSHFLSEKSDANDNGVVKDGPLGQREWTLGSDQLITDLCFCPR